MPEWLKVVGIVVLICMAYLLWEACKVKRQDRAAEKRGDDGC